MQLEFMRVYKDNTHAIKAIYDILKVSGESMYINKGLEHWKTPYPIESIRRDVEKKEVYIIRDIESKEYVHTFQLEMNLNSSECTVAYLNKFATSPVWAGKGIGSLSMEYIEKICRENLIKKISLDVYDKSSDAIRFYASKKFTIKDEKRTKYFNVLIMEKKII